MSEGLFCGIEGGASFSKLALMKSTGEIICSLDGPASNHLLVGTEECQKRLAAMIQEAKKNAGLAADVRLDGLGLCMSGCEENESNRDFESRFMRKHSRISWSCVVASDTLGPLYTASPKGGLVLIAGTGSNSLLMNPDGTTARCGGWGHLLGDEASAMWISLKAVKTVFDDEDNLVKCPFSIEKVKELMLKHFKVYDKFGILEHCYARFNKTNFACLCEKLAEAATEEKDPLCCHLFYEAGKCLGDMVVALRPKVHKTLLEGDGGLPIVCVGSVFKSWPLLEKGFVERIKNHIDKCTLMTLNCSAALGAAYLGAKATGLELPLDYSQNTSVLYTYNQENGVMES